VCALLLKELLFILISPNIFRDAIISGANNLANGKEKINKMNIFPVPDGDTGTNMSFTINSASYRICGKDFISLKKVSEIVASAALRGAKGNSGTILSLLLKGISLGFKNYDKQAAKPDVLLKGLEIGVKEAYKAVNKPTEGTMLTVVRVAAEKARAFLDYKKSVSLKELWSEVCRGAEEALKMTPNLLPVLKKVGVVDAGGKGVCLLFYGMLSVFLGNGITSVSTHNNKASLESNNVSKDENKSILGVVDDLNADINFPYCTEFICQRNKKSGTGKKINVMKSYLETIGDCVVVVSDDNVVKVHVHSDKPGLAIQEGLKVGELIDVKISNMREQNRQLKEAAQYDRVSNEVKLLPAEPVNDVGFVSICAGNGIKKIFSDIGVNKIVAGGQSMNPSTDDIVKAVLATPAKTVFVLPNNKNIILSARQVIPLVRDRKVVVIETKTIPQGISAMLSYNPGDSNEKNFSTMLQAVSNVKTGQITFASRNAEFGSIKIIKDDIIGLIDGKLVIKSKNPVKACAKLVAKMIDKNTSFVNLIYGDLISNKQAAEARKKAESKLFPNTEISVVDGKQPIYHFIISAE
jgi:DAK2 domain fusion protein YloV